MSHPLRRRVAAVLATGALSVGALMSTGAPASATPPAAPENAGNQSLAAVLAADGNRFDRNPQDFDVLERAVLLVIEQRPNSRVSVLADGNRRVTGFLPTDQAFTRLVTDLTGTRPASERETFQAVRSLGVDAVKDVLRYHLVAGRTLTSNKVLAARGTRVNTTLGDSIRVNVRQGRVFLGDRNQQAPNPEVVVLDINRGNLQVGHAIDRVLRPQGL